MSVASDRVAAHIVSVVRSALDPRGHLTPRAAVMAVPPEYVASLTRRVAAGHVDAKRITTGTGASPGLAGGRLVLSADAAIRADDVGEAFVLARLATTAEDVMAIRAAAGIVTATGGVTSHAAVVARGCGTPAVVGASAIGFEPGGLRVGDLFIREGAEVAIDGTTGELLLGSVSTELPAVPSELEQLLAWADELRGDLGVRANADTGDDAATARRLGAQGIGLCRTEHMFLAPDRLDLMRRLILTDAPEEQAELMRQLELVQRADFADVLAAMDGLPVTVRLLDPPLHEFLPDIHPLLLSEADDSLNDKARAELMAVRRMHETNPMLGTRGVRLATIRPGLYQMQVRAIAHAVAAAIERREQPEIEIMIPFTMGTRELAAARRSIERALASAGTPRHGSRAIKIGAMIETPRMALVAGAATQSADFFSFGTNDLSQLTLGLSRDDVEARLVPAYVAENLLTANPFERLDLPGVGRLVAMAATAARAARPDIVLGMCGEQAAHSSSSDFVVATGLNYISCSPPRIQEARLALAQAVVRATDAQAAGHEPPMVRQSKLPQDLDNTLIDVLHAVRVKGFASRSSVEAICASPGLAVDGALATLRELGLVDVIASRGLWRTTAAGLAVHAERLEDLAGDKSDQLRRDYAAFLPLNIRFKRLCSAWQASGLDGAHTDDRTSTTPQGFLALHREASGTIHRLGSSQPRLIGYAHRLSAAAERVQAGEAGMLTGVMCDSYHDIWMELHEDLVQLLRIDRTAEGSF